ncbi:MAG: hypothetical protein PHV23_05970 [Candidatus Gracilibacteria bacterium]|nr:hypothetical protein [Candidatus Gracilibacteria bacterium]
MSVEKINPTPKQSPKETPVSPETKASPEAQKVLAETREKLKTISSREFLKISEGERLKHITKASVDSEKLSTGDVKEIEFSFSFDGKFNRELYLKTTAGQVLPKEVREVKVGTETYTRVGLKGEFFSPQNKRLTIHENTKLEVSKIGDTKEIEKQNDEVFSKYKVENKDNKELTENNFDDLLKQAIDRGIDPKIAMFVFGDSIKNMPILSIDRQVKLEELLTNYYRVKARFPKWNGNILEESEEKNNFVLSLLKETNSNWKEKAKQYGIKDEEIEKHSKMNSYEATLYMSNIGSGDQGLLDYISVCEGTYGNYNAIYGNGNQNIIDFCSMSLNEILSYQKDYKKSRGSAAIGKYQFMDYTLKDMITRYKLDGNAKFSPEMQDKLAYIKLEERGLNNFKSGSINKKDFQLGLSQEWASIAKDNTGLSYYHGDNMNNHASNAGKQIFEVLDNLYV